MHLRDLDVRLSALDAAALLRKPDDLLERQRMQEAFGDEFIDGASNDYLGLAAESLVRVENPSPASFGATNVGGGAPSVACPPLGAPAQSVPIGAGSSRLIFGSHSAHLQVEARVASWLRMPSGLLFTSGYAANVGALGALLDPEDAVFSDRLNHASIIDGVRLGRVKPQVFDHLDLGHLEALLAEAKDAPARWVAVESYYSMDGDGPDLQRLRDLCDAYDAHLYVDEAHSVGTFGPAGAGLCCAAGIRADVLVAAFGKSVGAQGACVLGTEQLRTLLWNRARSFVFSTGVSPLLATALEGQIRKLQDAEAARARLLRSSTTLRNLLRDSGVALPEGSFGPVLGIVVGAAADALRVAEALRCRGILAQAVRPPTVPEGQSRIRLVLRASHTEEQLLRLHAGVIEALREVQALS